MKLALMAVTAIAVVFGSTSVLFAQNGEKPFVQEEKRQELESLERKVSFNQDFLWSYGGWYGSQFTTYDDEPVRDDRTVRIQDLRLWGDVEIARRWKVYGRVLNQLVDYNEGDQYKHHDNRWRLLRLDQGFVSGDLKDYARRVIDDDISEADLQVGRQFFQLGSGLVLNNIFDGLRLKSVWGPVEFTVLGARTKGSEDNLDQTHPDYENDRRFFYGAQVSYRKLVNPRPYLFLLIQRDANEEEHDVVDQNFEFDSEYFGGGLKAAVLTNVMVNLEAVLEKGDSRAAGSTEREDVKAYALTSSVRYAPDFYSHPEITVGFMRGSGDKDRASTTNTIGGNAVGSDDTNFNYFGFVQTGYSLYPRLSNIDIYRVSLSTKLLEKWRLTRDLDAGVSYYRYRKVKSGAGISDTDANRDDIDVGHESDLFIRWRALSDIGVTLNFGRFIPGSAYQEDKPRDYFNIGVTYSF